MVVPSALVAQGYAGPEKPGAAELRNALRRLHANSQDLDALIDAGTASLQLGDTNGAIDFFSRAEAIAPNNGDVKVGLAIAMLRKENPVEAIRLFNDAERLGMPTRSFALDRGLAYDLVGDFVSAERQYQTAALSGPSDEITLRRGISLGVQGRQDESLKLMSPLLTKNDPGAWRAQAFIYAANGNMQDANEVAVSFLGAQKAQAMQPYFQRMPLLTPAQKMAAIHFGHFPTQNIGQDSPQIAAMARAPSADRLTPQGQPFGPNTPQTKSPRTPSGPTQPKFLDFGGRPQKDVRYTPPLRQPVEVAVAVPNPVASLPQPQPQSVAVQEPIVQPPQQIAPPEQARVDVAAPNLIASQVTPSQKQTEQEQPAQSQPALPSPAVAAPAFESLPSRIVEGAPQNSIPAGLPSGYKPSVLVSSDTMPPVLPPAGYSSSAGTYVDGQGVTRRIGEDGSTRPAAVEPAIILPQPEAYPQTQPVVTTAEVNMPPAVQSMATQGEAVPTPAVAGRPDLSVVVGSVAVPEEEKTTNVVPVTPDVIAKTPVATPSPRVVTPKTTPVKASEAKTAMPKVETAKPTAKPSEKPAAKHPKRNWVQIASGGDVEALRYDYRNAARKNPDLFKGLSGWTAPYGKTRRMVVGPFDTYAEAQAWLKKYVAAGGQALIWQSADGAVVEPLPTR